MTICNHTRTKYTGPRVLTRIGRRVPRSPEESAMSVPRLSVRQPLVLALAAVALVAATRPAAAQRMSNGFEQPHMVRFGIAGGAVVPTSDARVALKTGIHGQAFVLVNVLPSFPLRFNLGYQHMDLKEALNAGQTSESPGSQSMISGVAGTQIDLIHGPLRPYIVAGVGGFDVRNSINALSTQGSTVSTSSFKFGIDGGAGL